MDIWGVVRRKKSFQTVGTENRIAINNIDKAELNVQMFVKIHSSGNLSDIPKQCRNETLAKNLRCRVNVKRNEFRGSLDLLLSMN